MTVLEDKTWPGGLCQNCGSHLGDEQCVLRFNDGRCDAYCSPYCRDRAVKSFPSGPIFQDQKRISLRRYILRSPDITPIRYSPFFEDSGGYDGLPGCSVALGY
jgi:hypothetical protein